MTKTDLPVIEGLTGLPVDLSHFRQLESPADQAIRWWLTGGASVKTMEDDEGLATLITTFRYVIRGGRKLRYSI